MLLIKMVLLFYSDYASVVLFCWLLYIFYQRHFHVLFFLIKRGGAEGTPVGATWEKPNYEIFV